MNRLFIYDENGNWVYTIVRKTRRQCLWAYLNIFGDEGMERFDVTFRHFMK